LKTPYLRTICKFVSAAILCVGLLSTLAPVSLAQARNYIGPTSSCSGNSISPATLPNGTLDLVYSQTLTFSTGGYGEIGWSLRAGALPDGLTLTPGGPNGGKISGTPTAAGTFNFTVRAERTGYSNNRCGERSYTVVVKAASATTLTASANPAIAGQTITLTARVSSPSGGTPTGTVQFSVNGSPVGAMPVVGDTASFNITAPAAGSQGFFTATANYSGDDKFWPSSNGLTVAIFDFLVQDGTTGDQLFFNSNGVYRFNHFAGELSLVLSGKGEILPSAAPCTVFLEHIAADREVRAEVNTCEHTGTATVIYQGVTYTLAQGAASSLIAQAETGGDGRAPELPTPVCDSLQVSPGHQVAFHAYALGVQIYKWNGTSWDFVAPEATLYANASFRGKVGIHYAGPTWESNSGSKVVAKRLAGCAPDSTAIDWLLLEKVSTDGPGIFSHVTHIQRVNTTGGKAPIAPGAFIGAEARVPYTAEYYFYRARD
jgi:hypothetical protein